MMRALGLALLLAGPAAAADVPVTIHEFRFDPETVTVARGDRVVWTNRDDTVHTVVDRDGHAFASPPLDTGDSFAAAFAAVGIVHVTCTLHPHMQGTVVVR